MFSKSSSLGGKNTRGRAILIGLSVTLLWSSSWVLMKAGLREIPPLTFAGLRYSLACLCLLPVLLHGRIRLPPRRFWPRLAALGLLLYAGTQGAMFVALSLMPAITVNLLMSFSTIAIALLGIVFLAERPTPLQWLGISLATAGAMLYFHPAGLLLRTGQYAGIVISAFAVLTNAGSAILGRAINRTGEVSPLAVTITSMAAGSLVLLPAGIILQGFPPITPGGWLIIAWLAVVNTAFAFTVWNHILRTLSAAESGIINSTLLVWIPILAVIFLRESLSLKQVMALVLVGVGTLAVQLRGPRK